MEDGASRSWRSQRLHNSQADGLYPPRLPHIRFQSFTPIDRVIKGSCASKLPCLSFSPQKRQVWLDWSSRVAS
jgi:hypothetical protein